MLKAHSRTFTLNTLNRSLSFLLLFIAQVTLAQEPQNSIETCKLITNTIERFTCYDNVEQAPVSPAKEETPLSIYEPVTTAEPAPQAASANNTPDEQFGLPKAPVDDAEREELFGKIADLRQIRTSRWAITLENGQIWHQVSTKRYNLTKGMNVRIYPTQFGSDFRLSSTSVRGFIQVKRVK